MGIYAYISEIKLWNMFEKKECSSDICDYDSF